MRRARTTSSRQSATRLHGHRGERSDPCDGARRERHCREAATERAAPTCAGRKRLSDRLLIVRHGLLIAGAGLALGMAGAVVLTRLMRSLLFGVGPTDGATYLLVGALVAITALAACYLPARKAARLDPMRSLRSPR